MALRISPAPSAVLHSNRAAAYCSLGKYGPALEDAMVALSLDPGNPKYHVRKAGALMGAGQLSDAGDAYERALQIEPGYAAALEGVAALSARMMAEMGAE
ncbi:hypothetical protein FOA52_009153 [Chlamydomonas sp. UWO 241]|nr:hypothetical protein FOA52_009153 [Chlamydomonas sp. UWO 241]